MLMGGRIHQLFGWVRWVVESRKIQLHAHLCRSENVRKGAGENLKMPPETSMSNLSIKQTSLGILYYVSV